MAFAPVFRPAFPGTFDRHQPVIAAAGWWVVAGKTTVAAYQAKGAASLAASYINLANPGTYDAAPGSAPTWAAGTGWTFDRATQYLLTGIIPTNDQTWSILLRCSDIPDYNQGAVLANSGSNRQFGIFFSGQSTTYFLNGGFLQKDHSAMTAGVWAIAGNTAYINGTAQSGTIGSPSGSITSGIAIGANWDGSTAIQFFGGNIQAVAIYSDTLTAGEIATVSAAMAAL